MQANEAALLLAELLALKTGPGFSVGVRHGAALHNEMEFLLFLGERIVRGRVDAHVRRHPVLHACDKVYSLWLLTI